MMDMIDGDDGEAVGETALVEIVEGAPSPPQQTGGPAPDHPHYDLWRGVKRALSAVPSLFQSGLSINGMRATDLFALNSSLGTSIENAVVEILNGLRDIWDPANSHGVRAYRHVAFVRQSQSWPDVLLTTGSSGDIPLMGIELKGWFVLSKEGEPSFRYKVSPSVCTDLDLLAVFPWALDEVLSGKPRLMSPYIEEARYAAEMRNYYWRYERASKGNTDIRPAPDQDHYPKRGKKFLDVPVVDEGGNFGRASRAGIMSEFIKDIFEFQVSGIPVKAWHAFFTTFRESADLTAVTTDIKTRRIALQAREDNDDDQLAGLLRHVLDYIETVTGAHVLEGAAIAADQLRITVDAPHSELQARIDAADTAADVITLKAGSMTLAAIGQVQKLKSRLKTLAVGNIDKVRIDIAMDDDGLLKIVTFRKP